MGSQVGGEPVVSEVAFESDRILRYEVKRDDLPHLLVLSGDPVAVNAVGTDWVEFWAIHCQRIDPKPRTFLVVGTGHPLPPGEWRHWGTVVVPLREARAVWHLMEGLHA